jgi:hypothetical protein
MNLINKMWKQEDEKDFGKETKKEYFFNVRIAFTLTFGTIKYPIIDLRE